MRKLIILLIIFIAPTAFACSCAPVGPACKVYWGSHSKAVFVGRVESVQKVIPKRAAGSFDPRDWPYRLVSFTVTESFTSRVTGKVKVRTGFGEADCGLPFEAGKDYLVWASGDDKDNVLYAGLCSRTREARYAADDLEFLRSVATRKETAWICGEAKEYTHDPNFKRTFEPSIMDHYRPAEEAYRSLRPLTGTAVTATDEKGRVYTSTVDIKGEFKIDNLPPGAYILQLHVPETMFVHRPQNPTSVTLAAKSCEEVDFRTAIDGRISGVLTDDQGAPVANESVDLRDIHNPDHFERQFEAYTDENGRFVFYGVPPGDYQLGANWDAGTYAAVVRTYFPGVEDLGGAQVLHLGVAQKLERLDFKARRQKKK